MWDDCGAFDQPRACPCAASVGVTVLLTLSLHYASGTPEILATVVPVLMLGSLYCIAYVANLERELGRRALAQGPG